MKNQALFGSKDNSKKLKCRLLQFLFGALRVKISPSAIMRVHYMYIMKFATLTLPFFTSANKVNLKLIIL